MHVRVVKVKNGFIIDGAGRLGDSFTMMPETLVARNLRELNRILKELAEASEPKKPNGSR